MKRRTILFILMTCFILVSAERYAAALPGNHRAIFSASHSAGQPGDRGTAVIHMALPSDCYVGGLSLAVYYDDTVFTVDQSTLVSPVPDAELQLRAGQILLSWVTGSMNMTMNGELLRFDFQIKPGASAGDYSLTLGCGELYTPFLEDIPYTVVPGILTVEKPVRVESVTVTPSEASVFVGRTLPLTACIAPAQAAAEIEWQTSDAQVASVFDGIVTAHRAGTAVISAVADGKTASCRVTVRENAVISIGISQMPNKKTYYEGEPFDPSGLIVTARYADGSSHAVSGFSTSGFLSTAGIHTITVAYLGQTAHFSVTVQSQPPQQITSSVYRIQGNILQGIRALTTVDQLLSSLSPAGVSVYRQGVRQSGGALVGTGMTVQLEAAGKVVHTLNVAVTGDANGDGAANALDLLIMKRDILGIESLSPLCKTAADMNGDGVVNALDLLLLKRAILGI